MKQKLPQVYVFCKPRNGSCSFSIPSRDLKPQCLLTKPIPSFFLKCKLHQAFYVKYTIALGMPAPGPHNDCQRHMLHQSKAVSVVLKAKRGGEEYSPEPARPLNSSFSHWHHQGSFCFLLKTTYEEDKSEIYSSKYRKCTFHFWA